MRTGRWWLTAMTMISIASLTSGCASRPVVIPADKVVRQVYAGQVYVVPSDGYFVPKARMLEILDALAKRKQ
jgi:hypothetical protein